MSFFGDMLMGGVGGAGKGYGDQAAADDKLALLKSTEQARLAQALQVEQMRSEDRRLNQENMMAIAGMRYGEGDGLGGSGGGSGGGGGKTSGINLMAIQMKAYRSGDPKEQQMAVDLTNTYQGPDAAATLADKLFHKPIQETVSEFNPAAADTLSTRAGAEANPTLSTSQNVTRPKGYDGAKGASDLQRLLVMAGTLGGNSSGFADAQRANLLTDGSLAVGKEQMAQGIPLDDVVKNIQANSNSKLDPSKQDLGQQRIDASLANAGTRAVGTAAGQIARALQAAQTRLAKARTMDEFGTEMKAAKSAAIETEQATIERLLNQQATLPVGNTADATAPAAAAAATSPSAAAAAFKRKALAGVK
jgi:hypothetical protein